LNSGIPGQLGNIVRLWLKQTNKKMKGEREEGREGGREEGRKEGRKES
jgi:hypothetical protein